MDVITLLKAQTSQNLAQLEKAVDGVEPEKMTLKTTPQAMSLHEHLVHLQAVSQALLADSFGEFDWDGFKGEGTTAKEQLSALKGLREKVGQKYLTDKDEDISTYSSYLTLHEAYHIGQMSRLRQELQPGWSSYSLYE